MTRLKLSILVLLFAFITDLKSQTIQQIGYYSNNGIFSLSSVSDYMVLGNGRLVNVSNPSSPSLTASVSFNGVGSATLVDSNYVYFGTGMTVSLIIADISNPSFPLQVGSKNFPQSNGGVYGLAKKNNTIYLTAGNDGIYSVDVTNATNPIVLDSLVFLTGQSRDIVIKNNYAYVANGDGLKVINISNPSSLTSTATIGSGYNSIALSGNLVFLGKNSGGIDVFNISNPVSPTPAFAIPNSSGTAWDLQTKNNLIYLATNSGGLFIYRFNSTSASQMANFPNTGNGQSFGVAVKDSLILLSGLINGVAILKYDSTLTVGIDAEKPKDQVKIFPNPAKNYIEFSLPDEKITEIELTDMSGKTVLNKHYSHSPQRLDVSSLPTGNYMIHFKNSKGSSIKELIIIE